MQPEKRPFTPCQERPLMQILAISLSVLLLCRRPQGIRLKALEAVLLGATPTQGWWEGVGGWICGLLTLGWDNGGAHAAQSPLGTFGIEPGDPQQDLLLNSLCVRSFPSRSHFPTRFLVLPEIISNPCQWCLPSPNFPRPPTGVSKFHAHPSLPQPSPSPVHLFFKHTSSSPPWANFHPHPCCYPLSSLLCTFRQSF